MTEALFYRTLQGQQVKCVLCPRECVLGVGQRGYCRAKENRNGRLYSTVYGQVSSIAIDPIEKKPLFHFYPGTDILSVGTVGCNLDCKFCQNWHIAQEEASTQEVTSEELVQLALEHGVMGIAFTYSEPLVWYEYILDTATLAKAAGLKTVLVTNGLIHAEPLRKLVQYIDAVNLDVKGFRQEFYQDICGGGDLETVKQTAEIVVEHCLLEVTTLLIPGLNDDPGEVQDLVRWLGELNPDIPLHLSRYFPQYQMEIPPTPIEGIMKAREIAQEHLRYVYLGNMPSEERDTYCYRCHYPVVKRGWQVKVDLQEGLCPECGVDIYIRV